VCRGFSPAYTEQEDINAQLNAVKLKLEERRKKIEDEKRKMEVTQRFFFSIRKAEKTKSFLFTSPGFF
jgi:hypothetical protein